MIVLDPVVQETLLGRRTRDVLTPNDRVRLAGQRVLVTGAGGSIGSELTRQLAACGVERLTLLDNSEYALFRIETEIRHRYPALALEAVLGDVTRAIDLRVACDAAAPHVVYHAAAYKHVTMTERAIIPALRTNVLGTALAARAARTAGARFVLISSDKAAEPRSVMGASKRFAELLALDAASPAFRPIVVRFGNILGSSGSVVEIMLRCATEGRNIPITDPEATRYFMTASEAVSLVLKADRVGRRAEVFWLDMGEPIRIGDLAARMIQHTTSLGLPEVAIDVIGLRPGEKRREELTNQGLTMQPTAHPRIFNARQREIAAGTIRTALTVLSRACARGDVPRAVAALASAVVDFVPSDTVLQTLSDCAAAETNETAA